MSFLKNISLSCAKNISNNKLAYFNALNIVYKNEFCSSKAKLKKLKKVSHRYDVVNLVINILISTYNISIKTNNL